LFNNLKKFEIYPKKFAGYQMLIFNYICLSLLLIKNYLWFTSNLLPEKFEEDSIHTFMPDNLFRHLSEQA